MKLDLKTAVAIFWRSARYEAKFLRHNRWDFSVMFWLPFITIILIWWIFSRSFITNLPIGVLDESHSSYSQTLTQMLDASPDIAVTNSFHTPQQANDALLSKQVHGVVIIPHDFANNINQGKPAPVILKVNAQYGTHSGILQRGVQSVVATVSAGVEIKRLAKQGVSPEEAKIRYAPIAIQRISLFNQSTNYQQFLASTVLPALLHILAMIIGATTIGRELRDKTLQQWYDIIISDNNSNSLHNNKSSITTNTDKALPTTQSPSVLALAIGLNGKFLWAILAYSLWGAVALLLADISSSASLSAWFLTYVTFILLMMISLWLGAIFTLASFSLRIGLSATGFVSAPSYAFAGVTFPYVAMSDGAKYWADILPMTHYLKLQISQLQMKAPLAISLPIFYGFIPAVAVCLWVTALLTKRALAHPERWGAR